MATRVIEVTKDNIELVNVIYDAITKHENAGGIAGLIKTAKLVTKLEEFCVLKKDTDIYELKDSEKTYNFFVDDDEKSSIESWFDAVKWHPMKAVKIVAAYELLKGAKEVKLEVEKRSTEAPANGPKS